MIKRIIIFGTIVIVALAALYYFYFSMPENAIGANVFNAVPSNAALVVKINQPLSAVEKTSENQLWRSLSGISDIKSINKLLTYFNDALVNNIHFAELFGNGSALLSIIAGENGSTSTVLMYQLFEKKRLALFENELIGYCKSKEIKVEKNKEHKAIFYSLTGNDSIKCNITICWFKGLLFVSGEKLTIDDLLTQLNSGYVCDPQLESLIKTAGDQSEVNLFINHNAFVNCFENRVSKASLQGFRLFNRFAQWSEFDISFENDKWLAGGFSTCSPDEHSFAQVVKNQKPFSAMSDQVVPAYAQYFINLSLSDAQLFFADHERYLDAKGLLELRNRNLKVVDMAASANVFEIFKNIFDNETTVGSIEINNENVGNFWLLKTKSGSYAFDQISSIQESFLKNKNLQNTEWQKTYTIDEQTSIKMLRFPFPDLPSLIFGDLFANTKADWVALVDNFLVFGSSFEAVSSIVHANILRQTLANNAEYEKFKANLSDKTTINFYSNLPLSSVLVKNIFKEEIAKEINGNNELLKFKHFAWQVSSSGDMVYNNAVLDYNPEVKKKSKAAWQCKLASYIDTKPQFVRNPSDIGNKDILVQDGQNILYLINHVGRTIWQMQLEAPVLSSFHTIDYYKNGKVQYLFNTENKIYLIDREGNNLANFPIGLRAKATNGVSVFDYENNRNYRFFVACADKNIYGYDENGKILEGWDIFKTDHEVKKPIQHIRVEGKDFVVASDEMKDYFLHRRGNVRIETNTFYQHSENSIVYYEERTKTREPRFVTTDNTGKLHFTYLDGKHEVAELKNFSQNHFFVSANIDNMPENEYIYADSSSVSVFDHNGQQILVKSFESPISYMPEVFSIGKSKHIGVTIKSANLIYLFGLNGEEYKGFPYEGNTQFSVTMPDNERINIITGTFDGYLNLYVSE